MDQTDKESNEEQEKQHDQSYHVNVRGSQTIVGDHTTIQHIEDKRKITIIIVSNTHPVSIFIFKW